MIRSNLIAPRKMSKRKKARIGRAKSVGRPNLKLDRYCIILEASSR